jgi:hypothetical protein
MLLTSHRTQLLLGMMILVEVLAPFEHVGYDRDRTYLHRTIGHQVSLHYHDTAALKGNSSLVSLVPSLGMLPSN